MKWKHLVQDALPQFIHFSFSGSCTTGDGFPRKDVLLSHVLTGTHMALELSCHNVPWLETGEASDDVCILCQTHKSLV